jgi:methyl-accepting chemotaxis protein
MNLGIRTKLLAGFGAVLALMILVGSVGVWGLNTVTEDVRAVAEQEMAAVVAALDAQNAVRTIQRDLRQALLVDGEEATRKWQASIASAQKKVTADVAELERLLYLPAGRAKYATLAKAYSDWSVYVQKASDLAAKGDRDGAKAVIFGAENTKALDTVNAAMDDLVEFKKARAAAVVVEAQESGRSATALTLGLVVFAGVLGASIAFFLARGITRAVAQVASMAKQIAREDLPSFVRVAKALADGDLTQDAVVTALPIAVKSKDELGVMAADFNVMIDGLQETGAAFSEMTANLRDVIGQVKESAIGLAGTSDQLGQAASQTSGVVQQVTMAVQNVAVGSQETSRSAQSSNEAVVQLGQAIDGIAQGASEQARQVQAVSATATQMAAGVEQVASNAQQVASASQQTKASAEQGAKAVRETVDGMSEIKLVVATAAGKVEELGKLGDKIGTVVETIDDIAEQTNLLALNAAIEAARAGEHGRGFAVVADEVRKLAERSQRETKAISELIREVQAGTKDAVNAMHQGSVKVEQGSARADEAGKALGEILQAVDATVGQVTEIATAAQEMAKGARGVVDAMSSISAVVEENSAATEEMAAQAGMVTTSIESIAAVSEENSAATEEVSASAEEMSAQVEEMNAQAEELAATAEQLKSLVARFQIEEAAGEVVTRRRSPDWNASPSQVATRRAS